MSFAIKVFQRDLKRKEKKNDLCMKSKSEHRQKAVWGNGLMAILSFQPLNLFLSELAYNEIHSYKPTV